jgi:hypothetical protein
MNDSGRVPAGHGGTDEGAGVGARQGQRLWVVVAAVAGLGVVVNAASATAPVSTVLDVELLFRRAWDGGAYVATAVPVAAVIAGLLLVRWWPWLLLVGAGLALPLTLTPFAEALRGHPGLGYLGTAGVALALLSVLAAAQELLDDGAPAGMALAGGAFGAGLIGAGLVGVGWLRVAWRLDWTHVALALISLTGAVLAVLRLRPPTARLARPSLRVTIAGALAAMLAFVPAVVTNERVGAVLDVSAESLARRP